MTHSGGMPHEVGDRGQRFEVSFYDPDQNKRRTLGWSETIESARQMAAAIESHPRWQFVQILDRHAAIDAARSEK